MRMKYTVTTITKRCPHCGEVMSRESHGEFTPIISCIWFIILPILIPYVIIKYLGFGNPNIPKVGLKYTTCQHCYRPVQTENCLIDELYGEDLLNYQFRILFYVAYVLGAAFCCSIIYLLAASVPIVSLLGLSLLVTLCGVFAIIITYRIKLLCINHESNAKYKAVSNARQTYKQIKTNPQNNTLFCRKCGAKLLAESVFCTKCGAKVIR